MDDYIRNLRISRNKDPEYLFECWLKIRFWLEKVPISNLCKKDLQVVIKGVLFCEESFKIFGGEFEKVLRKPCSEASTGIILGCNPVDKIQRLSRTDILWNKILEFNTTLNIFFIEKLLKKVLNENDLDSLLRNIELKVPNPFTGHAKGSRHKMVTIIERLFEVASEQIDIAIKQLLENIEFNIIGYIFVEPKDSLLHMKCEIVIHKICSLLETKQMTFSLFNSMYFSASSSYDGMQFFLRTIKHAPFYFYLMKYFKEYLRYISEIEVHRDHFKDFYFPYMIFLIKICLDNSHHHHNYQFFNKNEAGITNYINKICCIYDC